MFSFAPDDEMYQPAPVPPAFAVLALRDVITAVRLRISYIGHAAEPRYPDGRVDWSKPLRLMASALELSAGMDWPTHTVWSAPTVVVHAQTQKGEHA